MTVPPLKTAEVLDSTAGVLSPYLGKLMAQASAGAHCRDLQIDGDSMDRQKVDALVERLGKGLNLFLGRDKSKQVVEEMLRALDRLAGGPPR
jgi:hypothetical protein